MEDKEIIKALECCCGTAHDSCRDCPYDDIGCEDKLEKDALDLINRQKAEIERLTEENEIKSQKRANIFEIANAYERGRTEAIKEITDGLVTMFLFVGVQT